jgi:hypothetical protein
MNEPDAEQDEHFVGLADLAATLVSMSGKRKSDSRDTNDAIKRAGKIAVTVVEYTVRRLKRMTDCRLPGDDPNLKNVWEEICVQVQGDDSLAWHDYVELIESILRPAVDALNPIEQRTVWLAIAGGRDWESLHNDHAESEREADSTENADSNVQDDKYSPPVDAGEIVNYLKDLLLTEAEDFANENIRRYLVARISV